VGDVEDRAAARVGEELIVGTDLFAVSPMLEPWSREFEPSWVAARLLI
jgi:hypothetical protein